MEKTPFPAAPTLATRRASPGRFFLKTDQMSIRPAQRQADPEDETGLVVN